jgi:hypothetical protein
MCDGLSYLGPKNQATKSVLNVVTNCLSGLSVWAIVDQAYTSRPMRGTHTGVKPGHLFFVLCSLFLSILLKPQQCLPDLEHIAALHGNRRRDTPIVQESAVRAASILDRYLLTVVANQSVPARDSSIVEK